MARHTAVSCSRLGSGSILKHPGAGPSPHRSGVLEPLEPRLLLSANLVDPAGGQQDFEVLLNNSGFAGLESLGISATLDLPDGFVTTSGTQPQALQAAGLVDVGTQPQGALSGKIVYVHGGHGFKANSNGSWGFQRPEIAEINEDLSNQDMMTFLVDVLWNAGATVVPLRPVGHQLNEVILDNDDAEVTFVGSWSNSSSSIFYGSPGDTPYRFANTSPTETAYARYRPNIPEAGFYPVYTWASHSSNRVNQLYRVTHSGGATEVSINHRRVGNGLVYLGTYHFQQGTDGYVDISNRSSESGVVIADMIRFGNGIGDISPYGTTSGTSRENEPGVYWIEQNLGQGISSSEYGGTTSTVSAPPRFAEFMNREADGSLSDRVFISYHSNAGGGRGAVGLHNTSSGGDTPNQFLLADILGGKVNDDMSALNGTFEHNWSTRSSDTYQASFNYGEINNSYINDEFDATILEWAFHDSSLDLDLMRDADVRIAVARATYQGLQQYFNSVDGGATGLTFLPDPVTETKAETNGDGNVTLSWTPPTVTSVSGHAPTGYMVYTSLNGYGFDGGTYVSGGATTSHAMTGLSSANGTHYFRVVAVNAGGESLGSPVVAATPLATQPTVLIVNGFDRLDRNGNSRESQPNGWVVDRVRPRFQNAGDYAVQVAEAVEAFNPALGIDTAQNENIISGDVLLSDYDTVIWILGEESSADGTFNPAEQALVSAFITAGGDLFVSGAEIGWDLDNLNNGRSFFNNTLRADYVADDANTHNVTGAAGSIFAGLSFSFDDGSLFYDTEFPDVISPLGGAVTALNYAGGTGGGAAIQKKGSGVDGDVVMLAFPFETIVSEADRASVMAAALTFFGAAPSENPGVPNGLVATPGNDTVLLDWNDNVDIDLLGYDVRRATVSGGPFTTLNVSTVLVSQFTDSTAVNGTTYFYQVVAIDTDTNVSDPSIEVAATPDDHGDTRESATVVTLPSTTGGQVGTSIDTDWFRLDLNSGVDYSFSLLDSGLATGELRLYSSGLTLLATDLGPAQGGTLAQVDFSIAISDFYLLEVRGGGGATGDYQLAVQIADDHGNTINDATDLLGPFGIGLVEVGGDVDFFRVPVTAGLTYDLQVVDAGVPDAILTLYDNVGAIITQDIGSNPGGTHAQILWLAPTTADVFLSVAASPGSIGSYAVTVTSSVQPLEGDLNGDGFVGIEDLNIVLGDWNASPPTDPAADPTGDNFVGIEDLNLVLGNWNAGTPPPATAIATSVPLEQAAGDLTTQQDAPVGSSDDAASPSRGAANADTGPERGRPASPQATGLDRQALQAAWSHNTARAHGTGFAGPGQLGEYGPLLRLWELADEEDEPLNTLI